MERILKILVFFLLYLLLSSRSCDDDTAVTGWQQQQAELAKDSIRKEFQMDSLSEEALHAAEISAFRKLNDLADFIHVYADQSLDTAFRRKAGEMIGDLYLNGDAALSFGEFRNGRMKQQTLSEFLKTGFGENIRRIQVVYDSVTVCEPLSRSNTELYSGKLAAYQAITAYLETDSIILPASSISIEIYSSKNLKIIGPDTLDVWEVNLGDMK
jgi:hypothetical protein